MPSPAAQPPVVFVVAGMAASLVNFRLPLLLRFQLLGYVVHVCAPGLSDDTETARILADHDIQMHDVPFNRAGMNPVSDLRAAYVLYKAIHAAKANIVLAYTVKPVIWGMLAAAAARVPKRIALITGLGYAFTGTARGKRRVVRAVLHQLYRIALRRVHHVFFQNPDDRDEFRTQGLLSRDAAVTVVNGSGVDLARFPHVPLPPVTDSIRFVLIARMLGDKGIVEFVQAADRIRGDYPDAQFELVGGTDDSPDGISHNTMNNWAATTGVIWHGAQHDVRPYLATCHVYVLPSYREGTPRSVLEAMATGRAIITTDAPGCRETVTDGLNGFLVPPRDATALEDAMRRFLDDRDAIGTMGAQSLRIAREKYDVTIVNDQMMSDIGLIT